MSSTHLNLIATQSISLAQSLCKGRSRQGTKNAAAASDSDPDPAHAGHAGQSAAAEPPASRLNVRALERIFSFLTLRDLSATLAVSRLWSSAVRSMDSIQAAFTKHPNDTRLAQMGGSRLARHVGKLVGGIPVLMTRTSVCFMAQMSQLRALRSRLVSPMAGPLTLPPSLTQLAIRCDGASPIEIDWLILSIGHTHRLRDVTLSLAKLSPLACFAPLRGCAQLQRLVLETDGRWTPSPQQIYNIRTLQALVSLNMPMQVAVLRQMLSPPHQLLLHTLYVDGSLDADLTEPLISLPTLTHLFVRGANSLRSLPSVRTLTLIDFALPSGESVECVGHSEVITSLDIQRGAANSAQMSAILALMSNVSELTLDSMSHLESLDFLSSVPLMRALRSLKLLLDWRAGERMSVKELRHAFSLSQLTCLELHHCFSESLDGTTRLELKPPSTRLPKLIQSSFVD